MKFKISTFLDSCTLKEDKRFSEISAGSNLIGEMNIFKELGKFIGWLAGSFFGFGALFYAGGYIINRTHSHLLGLGGFIQHAGEYYLQEGANFFIVIMISIVKLFLGLSVIVVIFFIPFYLLFRYIETKKFMEPSKNKLSHINKRWPWLWKSLTYLILFFLLFVLIDRLEPFFTLMSISNLLYYSDSDSDSDSESFKLTEESLKKLKKEGISDELLIKLEATIDNDFNENKKIKEQLKKIIKDKKQVSSYKLSRNNIKNYLINGDWKSLRFIFNKLLLTTLSTFVLLWLSWIVTYKWRLHNFMIFPFVIVCSIYFILLPMAYGVLMKRTEIFPVQVIYNNKKIVNESRNLALVHKTANEFILWDTKEKKTFWIPKTEIIWVEIKQSQPLSYFLKK